MTTSEISSYLDKLFPNPICELDFNTDYELLIAVVLSAQTTDKKVNLVTEVLFSKYSLKTLSEAKQVDVESIVRTLGMASKRASYIIEIAKRLISEQNGKVPNNREYLESLPGVGRKVANVTLSVLFDEPAIAVDTHVTRVSKRLGLAKEKDSVTIIENKLMKKFPKKLWSRTHHQMVLFGRYYCKATKPECSTCELKKSCKYYKEKTPK